MQDYFSTSLEDYTVEEISAFCGPKDVYVDLLCDSLEHSAAAFEREAAEILSDCSLWERKVITSTMRTLKESLRSARHET